jgi:hypothetical protein
VPSRRAYDVPAAARDQNHATRKDNLRGTVNPTTPKHRAVVVG